MRTIWNSLCAWASFRTRARSSSSSIASRLQKFRLAAEGFGAITPPEALRPRLKQAFDPLPIWYPPHEEAMVDREALPAARADPAADDHVPFLGIAERLAAPDPRPQPALYHVDKARELGLADDDWVRVTSHNGEIKVQIRTMEGVNNDTVWTWNAIGKRAGAWTLDPDAPEARKGFLLNHLISELLARRTSAAFQFRSGHRPGGLVRSARRDREMRAGRGDQRAAIRRAAAAAGPRAQAPRINRYGAQFAAAQEATR